MSNGKDEAQPGKLRRQIGVFEITALSVAIMGPTGSMALNGSLTAATDGTATALAFLGALIAIALVAYSFIEFSRVYAHAGSVYIFTGQSFGARFGFLVAWLAFFTYGLLVIATQVLSANFIESFLGLLGIQTHWIIFGLLAAVVMWWLAFREVRLSTRTTLVVEGISVTIIIILMLIIVGRGGAHGLNSVPFQPGKASFSAIALAAVFGFLSFAGFEGAATLGEEAGRPKLTIPLALAAAVLLTGTFYVLCIYVQAEGFGTTAAGVKAFASSSAPLADLAKSYVGTGMALAIDLGAAVSAFASGVGLTVSASRILFALGRDGFGPAALGRTHPKYFSPYVALTTIMVVAVIVQLALVGQSAATIFGDLGTIGVLALLVVYIASQVSAMRLFARNGRWHLPQFLIPIAAMILMGYTFYSSVYPAPAFPNNLFPYIVLAWIVIGIGIVFTWPGLTKKIGRSFTEEGEPPIREPVPPPPVTM